MNNNQYSDGLDSNKTIIIRLRELLEEAYEYNWESKVNKSPKEGERVK